MARGFSKWMTSVHCCPRFNISPLGRPDPCDPSDPGQRSHHQPATLNRIEHHDQNKEEDEDKDAAAAADDDDDDDVDVDVDDDDDDDDAEETIIRNSVNAFGIL